jgi:glycosyltransferase involved in cell wall biosynthesis
MVDVSVVIPTRNRESTLPRAVATALGQVGVALEVIVVDDASATPAEVTLAGVSDERLRVVRRNQRGGLAGARNTGIADARGTLVAFLDDDDIWAPTKLAVQASELDRAGACWAITSALIVDRLYRPIALDAVPLNLNSSELLKRNAVPAGASNVVADLGVVRRLGGFDASFHHLADWDLWLRLADAGPPAVCAEPLVAYLHHGANEHLRGAKAMVTEFEQLAEKHNLRGRDVGSAEFLRWVAATQRRTGDRRAAAATYLWGARRYRSSSDAVRALAALAGEWALPRSREQPAARELPRPEWLPQVEGSS